MDHATCPWEDCFLPAPPEPAGHELPLALWRPPAFDPLAALRAGLQAALETSWWAGFTAGALLGASALVVCWWLGGAACRLARRPRATRRPTAEQPAAPAAPSPTRTPPRKKKTFKVVEIGGKKYCVPA